VETREEYARSNGVELAATGAGGGEHGGVEPAFQDEDAA
jgi:hypothetical protein